MTEEININSISKDDLPWIIEYDSEKCMLCGHCVAACSFDAIKVDVQKRKKVKAISNEEGFQIDEDQKAIPVIRQVIDAKNFCRGCGICTKVCPKSCIEIVDKRAKQDNTNCLTCLACVNACPKKALKFPIPNERFPYPEPNPNVRFKNPNVTLQEIIKANCQE